MAEVRDDTRDESTEAAVQDMDAVLKDEIAWATVSKENGGSKLFTKDNDLFRLSRIFNKLAIDDAVTLDIEEVSLFIQAYMKAVGIPWDSKPLEEFTLQAKSELTFWELINCLEVKYFKDVHESIYLEGLEELCKIYIDEIIKTGYLMKQGGSIKTVKKRWFVFTPHKLTYYETEDLTKEKGVIIINSLSTVGNVPDSKTTLCRFSLVDGETKRLYKMDAHDQRTKNEWIYAINNCIGVDVQSTPLKEELIKRANKRKERQIKESQEETIKQELEELKKNQVLESERLRRLVEARKSAEAEFQAINEKLQILKKNCRGSIPSTGELTQKPAELELRHLVEPSYTPRGVLAVEKTTVFRSERHVTKLE